MGCEWWAGDYAKAGPGTADSILGCKGTDYPGERFGLTGWQQDRRRVERQWRWPQQLGRHPCQQQTQPSNVTAPTQFVEMDGHRYIYRRFGAGSAPALLCLQHFTGTLDNWDPAVTDPPAAEDAAGNQGRRCNTCRSLLIHTLAYASALSTQTWYRSNRRLRYCCNFPVAATSETVPRSTRTSS